MSRLDQFFGSGPRVWVSGATYAIGNVLLSPADNYQQYVRITNGAGTTDPASDTTNYRPFGGRALKSVQRGVATPSSTPEATTTVTITAVDTSKSVLICNPASGYSSAPLGLVAGAGLTSSTQITIKQGASGAGSITGAGAVYWQVLEYY